jgi:hypothetical protein
VIAASVLRGDLPTVARIARETGVAPQRISERRDDMRRRIEGFFAAEAVWPEPEGDGSGG